VITFNHNAIKEDYDDYSYHRIGDGRQVLINGHLHRKRSDPGTMIRGR
jgi:hypothetical protein